MATVDKNFRIKNGLVVEGSTATVNGSNVLTEGSTEFIQDTMAGMVDGSHTNLTISYNDTTGKLTFTAENGVADSTTSDLTEGTNLYFTDERAVDAVATALGNGSHTNVTVTYDDNANSISLAANPAYTDENAQDAVGNAVGNGLDYDDNTGAISVDPSEFTLNQIGTAAADVSLGGFKITNLATPTASTDAVTKAYADSIAEGLHVHASAATATTTNISISADLEAGDVIDGVTLVAGDRVLVKDQTTASENGIYVVQASGAAVRATDFDQPAEVDGGDFIFVTGGTVNDNTGWVQTSTGVTTIGTDPIYFTQFSGAGTFTAGNGLTLTGNSFSINTSITADLSTAQTLTNKTLTSPLVDGNGVVFEGTTANEFETTLTVTDPTADRTITLPDVTGTVITSGDTGSVTNTMLAGSIANDKLTNSAITINGTSTSLGGTRTLYTDDITEDGSPTNLWFTSQRAVDALQAVVPDFTAVEVNDIARQVAATVSLTDTNATTAYSWAKADYRAAKFLVKFAYGTHTEVSEILLSLDTSDNIAITEYAVVTTNGSLGDVTADIDGSNVRIRVTAGTATTTCHVVGTLIR
jgi:hypothetical protein